jgi:hypothetical protein
MNSLVWQQREAAGAAGAAAKVMTVRSINVNTSSNASKSKSTRNSLTHGAGGGRRFRGRATLLLY